jgi:hypothetical protein
MIDIAKALRTGEHVKVTKRTKAGEARGWEVAASILQERLPMWVIAAGLPVPERPAVDGFDDLPEIVAVLRALPLEGAKHLGPEVRAEGLRLATATHVAVLRAVETALDHAAYPRDEQAQLCRVEVELERVLPMLGALAVQRHRDTVVTGPFDLTAWGKATAALAARLEAR